MQIRPPRLALNQLYLAGIQGSGEAKRFQPGPSAGTSGDDSEGGVASLDQRLAGGAPPAEVEVGIRAETLCAVRCGCAGCAQLRRASVSPRPLPTFSKLPNAGPRNVGVYSGTYSQIDFTFW